MKCNSLLEILDGKRFDEIGASELTSMSEHANGCESCARSFEAARVAGEMLRVRAAQEAPAPSAFFAQKVLAALRENPPVRRPIEAFRRWWQAAYPMVCTMALIVAAFAGLTVFAPRQNNAATSPEALYTADAVILNQRPPRNLTNEQALEMIYNDRPGKR